MVHKIIMPHPLTHEMGQMKFYLYYILNKNTYEMISVYIR